MRSVPGVRGFLAVIAASGALMACSGAEWKDPHVAQGYQPVKRLTVTVVADTTGEDLKEAVAEFTRTLADQLKSRGIDATIADGPAAPPGAQINVEEWNPGSQALRYFVGFGSGEGHMTVAVHVTGPDGADALQGHVRGYVRGGMWGGSYMAAPREAAKSIANAIATGKPQD